MTTRSMLIYLTIGALILFRTLPFVLFGREVLDADEAVYALMAKHLALGREFPVFMYGQKFLLAQSSWMAAPLFRIFGASVGLFRVPLLLINLGVGYLLVQLLKRDSRLKLHEAFLCSLWFLLPSLHTSRGLMNSSEGVTEPFLYLLLIWVLRRRPWFGGLIAGVGMAGRPFVFYGVAALLILESRSLKSSSMKNPPWLVIKTAIQWLGGAAVSYGLIQFAAVFSTNYMGGHGPFYLKSGRHMLEDVRGYFAEIIPQTIGLQMERLLRPPSLGVFQSYFNSLGLALSAVGAILLFNLTRKLIKERRVFWDSYLANPGLQFGFYLALVGILSFGAYVVMSPPSEDIRYTYQLLFGFIGIYVLLIQLGKKPWVKHLALVLLLGCFVNNLLMNTRNWVDQWKMDQEQSSIHLIEYLKAKNIRAAVGDYWCSHNITFIANEEIVIAAGAPSGTNIPQDGEVFRNTPPENRAEIRLSPCPGGKAIETWFVCPDRTGTSESRTIKLNNRHPQTSEL